MDCTGLIVAKWVLKNTFDPDLVCSNLDSCHLFLYLTVGVDSFGSKHPA